MNEPNEKWLDRHFRQQLMEYFEVFNRSACKSDQHIINYWLEIFQDAPKSEKWARNGLLLLMYGHLKELGYLQAPFTDMRNVGRNLNDILDSYTGLPVIKRHKSTQIVFPRGDLNEDNPRANKFEQSSKGSLSITSSFLKSQVISGNGKPSYTVIRMQNHRNKEDISARSADSIIPETLGLHYDTFDSHECYKQEATDRRSFDHDLTTFFKSVMGLTEESRKASTSHREQDSDPEMGLKAEQGEGLNEISSMSSNLCQDKIIKNNKSCLLEETSSPNSRERSEQKKKYKTKRELNEQHFSRCSANLASSKLEGVATEQSPTILDAEIFELRKRNKELRRQCLMYYTKSGKFRKEIRWPKVRNLGFLVGAYRAQLHFARWTNLRRRQIYFRQQFDGGHNWRSYRRLLLHSYMPRWRTQRDVDKKRQLILLRMSFVLQLKQVACQLSAQEMPTLLATLETKYLSLAKDLHSKLPQFIK